MQLGTTADRSITFLGTDFEKHAIWQGSVEKPTAKDFVARKVHTIEWNKVLGTSWSAIRCKECLRKRPAAVFRQATINLFTRLEIPWRFQSRAVLHWLSGGLCHARKCQFEDLGEKKRYDTWSFNGRLHEKPLQRKAEHGKIISVPGSHKHLTLRKCVMCSRNMGSHVRRGIQSTKGKRMGWEIGVPWTKKGARN